MRNATERSTRSWKPRVSPGLVRVFAAYSRRYLRQNFHALRILKSGLPLHDPTRPLVIYLNHAAWWDPLVCLQLSREFFPRRTSYAAMDAAMLKRYGFFKWLGFFGVARNEPGAGRGFLRVTRALLASAQNAVWFTPQGRFVDVRERPLRLQNGIGALAARHSFRWPSSIHSGRSRAPRSWFPSASRSCPGPARRGRGAPGRWNSPTRLNPRRMNSPLAPACAMRPTG